MNRVFLLMFVTGVASLVAWGITEPFAPSKIPTESFTAGGQQLASRWMLYELLFSALLGGMIGLAIGGLSGYFQGSSAHLRRGLLLGIVVGAIGGTLGLRLGGSIVDAIFGPSVFVNLSTPFATMLIARMIVFTFFGGIIGSAQGLATRSMRRSIQGFLGGVIGGAIGGAAFEICGHVIGPMLAAARVASGDTPNSTSVTEVGTLPRAIASVAIGMAIGLFVGLVERIARTAWLRLELGRNEGKEWTVDAAQTFIGRSENAHVPLFGDANIAPMHACIYRTGSAFRLLDGGTPLGVGLNGVRIAEAALSNGDVIQVGGYNLRFLTSGARRVPSPSPDAAKQSAPAGMAIDPSSTWNNPPSPTPSANQALTNSAHYPGQAPVQPDYFLVAVDGPLSGQRFDIGRQETVVGRESPQIKLDFDSSASRRHCAFVAGPSGVLVRDLGSTNGTLVNGTRVQEMALRSGDTVTIGKTTFRLE